MGDKSPKSKERQKKQSHLDSALGDPLAGLVLPFKMALVRSHRGEEDYPLLFLSRVSNHTQN